MLILFVAVFFCSIPSIDTLSSQEDLTIDNYHQLGCLALKPDKEYLVQYQQDSSLLPYQTYSSPQMSIVLCFRLCRRWVILINANQTTCTCLFTMSKAYQLKKYLGNVLPTSRCSSNDLNIYSLTKEFDILPSISLTHEWSLDGCYYLHGIQTVRANLELTDVNYIEGLDICRKHCQILRTTNYFSFFLSIRKSCYCLPMKFSPIILPLAVRKPLTHCSFLPLIQSRLKTQLNTSDIHTDTVVKIDVQRYCSSAFSFDETLYLCCKFAILSTQTTYSKLSDDTRCSPLLISSEEQWTHLRSLFSAVRGTAFVWIDRNSTYLFNELFANRSRTYPWNDLCLMFNRTDASQSLSFDLLSCSWVTSPGHTLCAQKPLETLIADQGEFQVM